MQGLGIFPFGLAPFGLGQVESGPSPATETSAVRELDPATGDYAIGADGTPKTTNRTAAQRVLIAGTTERGSVAGLTNFGIRKIETKGPDYQRTHSQNVADAIRHIDDIRVDRITVDDSADSHIGADVDFVSYEGTQ